MSRYADLPWKQRELNGWTTCGHRLKVGWAAGILLTPTLCLEADDLREMDFSDDWLAGQAGQGADWEAYESEQNGVLLRVYGLQAKRVRIDSYPAYFQTSRNIFTGLTRTTWRVCR